MANKIIVTSTGYGGTGSSAVSDILLEFSKINHTGSRECWLFQDLYGIRDLHYYLTSGFHRSKTSFAIEKFESLINRNLKEYEYFFGKHFYEDIEEFLKSLNLSTFKKSKSDFERHGIDIAGLVKLVSQIFIKRQSQMELTYGKNIRINKKINYLHEHEYVNAVQNLVKKIFNENPKFTKYDHIYMDQIVPANQVANYSQYFPNIRIIIVDRDPRDLFMLNNIIWKGAPFICDTSNVNQYIGWYRAIRRDQERTIPIDNVMHIDFEKLILDYDNSLLKLINFIGIKSENHNYKLKYFNPDKSRINMRLWESRPEFSSAIQKIEDELSDFIKY